MFSLTKRLILVGSLLLLVLVPSLTAVRAQDDMTHTCDSATVLLLLVAEYEYGFQSEMMDLSTFEKGQYAPLFDVMMSMMEEGEMTEEAMPEAEEMAEEEMVEEGMMLPTAIEGEDEACTALRAELDKFIVSHFMMMEDGG